ncbi:helix-turn-helix domain-containing protein [Parabacteroides hominis]|uniref:Helix-turn-helix domain-containing protein n=1 Tax=Parabacteroides hominis TaxID=2763057 RepID=A0ABR7DPA6_9BACT|nr:helix-turn-helix domain-containing protein [Parabacteroides hominis]MBC5633202.1 helix-turn-helix domain-containing protein [Parabacteroides hominis]
MKALLSSSDISIKEIAEQLHFEDTSYMCRYFKRHTGIPLSEYRK